MSTRRHCDVCNTPIVFGHYVTVNPGSTLTAMSPEFLACPQFDLCGDCWASTLEHLKTRKADAR